MLSSKVFWKIWKICIENIFTGSIKINLIEQKQKTDIHFENMINTFIPTKKSLCSDIRSIFNYQEDGKA